MRVRTLAGIVSVGALLFGFGDVAMSQASQLGNVRNVVLVHGGWVDGSGWEGVYKALKKNGYSVTIVQEATASLADDVPPRSARLRHRTARSFSSATRTAGRSSPPPAMIRRLWDWYM